MKLLRRLAQGGILAALLALVLLPSSAFASTPSRVIDFATFLKEVENANYSYDGQGVTVEWSPSSACTDNRPGHTCLLGEGTHTPDGNNAQRGQGNNAQYQLFSGKGAVSIKNVTFTFKPADFKLCMNNKWGGTFTAADVVNAELQLLNTGDVTFEGCTFNRVIASPYSCTAKASFIGCSFNDVYNNYAIKDVHAAVANISNSVFTNCGGGIYFEGSTTRTAIDITGNTFSNVDTFAPEDKKFTRGLVQFSAKGDYANAAVKISGNTSTGGAGAIRQLNTSISEEVLSLNVLINNNSFDGNALTDSSFGANTVYYNGAYYKTLMDALTSVFKSTPKGTAKVYCKPKADVGAMTHGHVADDMVIYGNGAYVSAGERDLEIDTYKFSRITGAQDVAGTFLDQDITVTVKELDGIAAWGQRNTAHTVNLAFENCKNMQRIYFTNGANPNGKINITLDGCSFDGSPDAALRANANTTVYSNSPGDISIKDTTFKQISVALNINHKSTGTQNIILDSCTFNDCATPEISNDTKTYGAPVRIVAQKGAVTNLTVKDCEFAYSEGKTNCGNGDILLGDGRHDAAEDQGVVTLSMNGTKANVMKQKKGFYGNDGQVADESQGSKTEISKDDLVKPNVDDNFVVDDHSKTKIVGAKEATCTSRGYTGDKVCSVCGKVLEYGKEIAELNHTYENGVCTLCGAKDPDYTPTKEPSQQAQKPGKPSKPTLPATGDVAALIAPLSTVGVALIGYATTRKKRIR